MSYGVPAAFVVDPPDYGDAWVRRGVLVGVAFVFAGLGVASRANPWNLVVFQGLLGNVAVLGAASALFATAELWISFRSFVVRVAAGTVAACAVFVLLGGLVLSPLFPGGHGGVVIATSPDGKITLRVDEGGSRSYELQSKERVYLRTTAGLDREVLVAVGCGRFTKAEFAFVGNRAVAITTEEGGRVVLPFDKNLGGIRPVRFTCPPYGMD
ncbi:hypothetical protein [Yinghuangia soli]|uniref:Uncharacterized protein n=1 Tax=Yinghuangia soli TaxID=2908204 RepID=A0AA41TYR2_9ACTN|nr:hypothetical protein [Yinghuangia soli]MCF2526681.1 hypothetical protein [Yinghuangia soli]